jgi:hypothetical protein
MNPEPKHTAFDRYAAFRASINREPEFAAKVRVVRGPGPQEDGPGPQRTKVERKYGR